MTMTHRARRGHAARRGAPAWAAGLALILSAGAAQPAAAAGGAPAPDPWVSTTPEGYYRFTAPQADVAAIVGSRPAVLELQGNIGPAGTWSDLAMDPTGASYQTMFGPVEPGLYYYQYTATTTDRAKVSFRQPTTPVAVTSQPSWNTFFVPGPSVEWMADVADGGALAPLAYDVDGTERSALVWTHPDYDPARGKKYPVLYLLADEAQSPAEWSELGRAPQILDNLAAEGRLEPMVVVMADVNGADPRGELLDSLAPAVAGAYRVSSNAGRQAVTGVGTGADLALSTLLTDPGRFGAVGSFSGSLDGSVSRPLANRINAKTDLVRLYVGNALDPAYNDTEATLRTLEAAGVEHEFDGVDPDQGGTWDTWREALRDFAPRLFHAVTDHGPRAGNLPLTEPYVTPATGSITTPDIDENGIVTFETGTQWADAKDVTVWGNWAPNGAWFRIPMTEVGDRWRLSLGPLDGFYYYRYVVDGVDQKDPADTVNTLTGVSPLYVPGENDLLLADAPAGAAGELSVLTYTSTVVGEQRSAYVWTPPGYDPERAEPYPVLYLNHGAGQSWGDWVEVGRAKQILDNSYLAGAVEPMVVVMPNGNVPNFQAELFDNVMPATRAAYHVSTDPSQQALAGLSMGAMNTLNTWLTRPGEFAYIGAFSGFLFGTPTFDAQAVNEGTTEARIYTGDISDFANPFTMSLMGMLDSRGVEYEFAGVTTGPHGFDTWSSNLIDFLPHLFRADGEAPAAG